MLSPDRILACWEESQVTDTDFVWQVQYFRCLREVLCDPTSFLCGRCNIFVSSEKFFVVLRSFCVAGAIFSMPPRSSPFVWQAQYVRCLREVPRDPTSFLCGRCNIFVSSEKCFVAPRSFCVAGAIFSMPPRSSFVARTQGSLVTPPPFCVAGAIFLMPPRSSRDTAKGCL